MDTGDARCQVPSDKLIRDAAAIFVWYDEDKDGLIEQTEWSKIMEKQGMADVTITEPLNLYQFEYYIIAYTLNEQGELDLNKLSVEVQETLGLTEISPFAMGASGNPPGRLHTQPSKPIGVTIW